MEEKKFTDLINQAKANNQTKTTQKVVSNKSVLENETQFSFYLNKALLKKLKQKALNNDESIKSTINKALENYLKTH